MAAPAAAEPPPTLVRMNEAEVKTTTPLPRSIQLVMAIDWYRSKSSTTATAASTETIGDLPGHRDRLLLWILPCMFILAAAGMAFVKLYGDTKGRGRELVVSGAGGFCFLAIPVLLFVYNAVLTAAGAHLVLLAPRTPVAAWEAFYKGTLWEWMGFILMLATLVIWMLGLIDQAWPFPLLATWTWISFLGLFIASIVAFWLCLLRAYDDTNGDIGGKEGREKNSCGERVTDGLAYLYCRLLYEFAVKIHPGPVAVADAGMQQLDADVAQSSRLELY